MKKDVFVVWSHKYDGEVQVSFTCRDNNGYLISESRRVYTKFSIDSGYRLDTLMNFYSEGVSVNLDKNCTDVFCSFKREQR